jgi:hypothetical protein
MGPTGICEMRVPPCMGPCGGQMAAAAIFTELTQECIQLIACECACCLICTPQHACHAAMQPCQKEEATFAEFVGESMCQASMPGLFTCIVCMRHGCMRACPALQCSRYTHLAQGHEPLAEGLQGKGWPLTVVCGCVAGCSCRMMSRPRRGYSGGSASASSSLWCSKAAGHVRM